MGKVPHEVADTDEYYEEFHKDEEAAFGGLVATMEDEEYFPPAEGAEGPSGRASEDALTKTKKRSDAEKRAAFSRLASSRASAAMDAMRLLGHLANPTQYAWDEAQEATLFDALEMGVKALRRSFEDARRGVAKNGKHLSLRV